MKIFEKSKLVVLAALVSGFVNAGEVDSAKITTFTSGTVISSSQVNGAVTEVVNQINDNNASITSLISRIESLETQIASLTPPADYEGINSRLSGNYKGFLFATHLGGTSDITEIYNYSYSFSVTLTSGAGTLSNFEWKSVTVTPDNGQLINEIYPIEEGNMTLTSNSSGYTTIVADFFNGSGFANRRGDFLSLKLTGADNGFTGTLVLYKE